MEAPLSVEGKSNWPYRQVLKIEILFETDSLSTRFLLTYAVFNVELIRTSSMSSLSHLLHLGSC